MSAVVENAGTPTVVVKITFDGTIGEGMDKAIAVIHDEATEATLYAEAERATGEIAVPIATIPQADVSRLHAYMVFARPPVHGPGDAGGSVGHDLPQGPRALNTIDDRQNADATRAWRAFTRMTRFQRLLIDKIEFFQYHFYYRVLFNNYTPLRSYAGA